MNATLFQKIAYALCLMCGLGFLATFQSALRQESDLLVILGTILRLELSRADALAINGDTQRLLVRNNAGLQHHLEAQGWTWVDQMGALTIYRQNSQFMHANCSMYSRFYMICDLENSA
ncbi:MAG: hypothetical protein AAF579_12760 [Cyanobacteria bacterium P01_C01_bin.118]